MIAPVGVEDSTGIAEEVVLEAALDSVMDDAVPVIVLCEDVTSGAV